MAAEDNHNEITLRGVILFKAALLGNKQKILGQSLFGILLLIRPKTYEDNYEYICILW